MAHREKFINANNFLKSARDMGIGVEEGVYEILDNSFDAGAENIWIQIDKKDNDNFQFIFIDDGMGIPKEHIDADGEKHQFLAKEFGDLLESHPTAKEELYKELCDKYIMKYRHEKEDDIDRDPDEIVVEDE
jgi:hypothetical protein